MKETKKDYKITCKKINGIKCYFILIPKGYKGCYTFWKDNHFYFSEDEAKIAFEKGE